MNKLATAFGCLLMLGAAIAPTALAHGDSGDHLVPWLGGAGPAASDTQPSGWYYGSASAWAQLNAFSAGTVGPAPGCPAPTGNAQVDAIICSLVLNADPSFTLAAADALCDMEVLGDGAAVFAPDEKVVDGAASAGLAPDGTLNDGGVGAVCHTHKDFYANTPYNTPGCTAGTATAEDAVVGTDVWISTTCDSVRPVAGDSLLTQVLSMETCAVNEVISGVNVPGVVACVQRFVDCTPVGAPGSCPATGATACVPDGVADASNAGTGSGVAYPGKDASCGASTDSSQATFVWNSVQVTVTSGGTVTPDVISTGVYGFVA